MMQVRLRCMEYIPGNLLSFDEGTAKYGGRMTNLKHRQNRFKPYDGIRIYMLNDSKTGMSLHSFLQCCAFIPLFCVCMHCAGYVANFRVDIRDGTPVAAMMRQVLDEFNCPGIKVYADNLFVTVDMLRWCKEHKINLCGTTRIGRGFPKELSVFGLRHGEFDWRMTDDGLLAVG